MNFNLPRPIRKLVNSIKKRTNTIFYYCQARLHRRKLPSKRLEIEVITMMYNEAILAPLFIRHYATWVDRMTVFYSESADDTRRILEAMAVECGLKRLTIIPIEFPNGFDDLLKIEHINRAVRESKADFVVCVDADEFVYPNPPEGADPRKNLAMEMENIVRCNIYHVYRHSTDEDIDPKKAPFFQRRHGSCEIDNKGRKNLYSKPCIVRPDSGVQFLAGCHGVTKRFPESRNVWIGAHWGKADVFCIERYVRDRGARLSENNKKNNLGIEKLTMTENQLRAELKAHENDPLLF